MNGFLNTPGAVCRGGDRRAGPVGDVKSYRGSGSAAYHPALLLGIPVYGRRNGYVFDRKLERATYDSVVFGFIAAHEHPDHETIATFGRRFLKDIEDLFVRVLELAREMGLLKLGTVALDGTNPRQRQPAQRAVLWARHESRRN